MRPSEPVIVVYVRSRPDWAIVKGRHWYRLPVRHGPAEITARWIAFYLPGWAGNERWQVTWYARIHSSEIVRRVDLFPHEPDHPRAGEHYHAISFDEPQQLARPLRSDRSRRFVYVNTTVYRLAVARGLEDIFSEEPLIDESENKVLVGVVPSRRDFGIIRDEGWYRVPLRMVKSWDNPGHMAFYLGQAFGEDAGTITHYAPVVNADVVKRIDLFPSEVQHPRAFNDYVRIHVGDLEARPRPIVSRRRRKLVLLPTTFERFLGSSDLNELYAGDAEEEVLYTRLTGDEVFPERQYYIRGTSAYHLTDLAVFCRTGNVQIDIEERPVADGLQLNREKPKSTPRGWSALRLSRYDISHRSEEVMNTIAGMVIDAGGSLPPEASADPT